MQWGTTNIGVIDLYRTTLGPLTTTQVRDTINAADIAALMILWIRTDPDDQQWPDHSARNRAEIHQAVGIVRVQLEISALDALARIRAYAFAEQRPLSDIAHDVVSERLHLTPDTT
jgi:hypothetical protein